jgi:hypothetical protein
MRKLIPVILFIAVLFLSTQTTIIGQEKKLDFTAAEAESMMFLFNQTQIKGSDVEVLAPLAKKLKAALEKAQAAEDKSEIIPLELSLQELQICLNVINNATFEARFAELVLSMKNKIKTHLPPEMMQAPAQPTVNE